MKNKVNRKCDTSLRVLQTLLVLMKEPASISDILKYFKKSEHEIYTSEVILKYINTLKVFGFRFVRENNKYKLLNEIPPIFFDTEELNGLNILVNLSKEYPDEKAYNTILKLKNKIERKFDTQTRFNASKLNFPIEAKSFDWSKYTEYKKLIDNIEVYCKDNQKLKITYKSDIEEKITNAVPLEIKYINNELYFGLYCPNSAQNMDIRIKDIINIEQLPTKINSDNYIFSSVTFKLTGRLAKTYKLKDSEKVFQSLPNGDIIISNYTEDRTILLHRLLRYGDLCEIISPVSLREDMKNLIASIKANYN